MQKAKGKYNLLSAIVNLYNTTQKAVYYLCKTEKTRGFVILLQKGVDYYGAFCYNGDTKRRRRTAKIRRKYKNTKREDEKTMKNFEALKSIFKEIDGLAERADRFKAQREARNAESDKIAALIWDDYTAQVKKDHENKNRAKVLCLNAAYYITTEILPAAAEIWNGYTGKKIGKKTREKIRIQTQELANAARLDCIIFYSDYISIEFSYKSEIYYDFNGDPDGSGSAYFTIDYYTDGSGERLKLYDESGRAAKINLNGVKKYSDFITDIDGYIKSANEASELIEQKKQELKDAQHAAAIYSDIFDPWNI